MAISHIGATSSVYSSSTASFTISKPSGVASGDILLAFIALYSADAPVGVVIPSGWSRLTDVQQPGIHQLTVIQRTVGSSDPAQWAGSLEFATNFMSVGCVAYRGTGPVVSRNARATGQNTTLTTGPVTNSIGANWRVTAGTCSASNNDWALDSPEAVQRIYRGIEGSVSGDPWAIELDVWDSGDGIATGSDSSSISRGAIWQGATAWVGILPATNLTSSGTMSASMPRPTVDVVCIFGASGSMEMTLPFPTVDGWPGIASPPEGTLSALVVPECSMEGYQAVFGTLALVVLPVFDSVAETRRFGSRVVIIEPEDRTVVVPRFISEAG